VEFPKFGDGEFEGFPNGGVAAFAGVPNGNDVDEVVEEAAAVGSIENAGVDEGGLDSFPNKDAESLFATKDPKLFVVCDGVDDIGVGVPKFGVVAFVEVPNGGDVEFAGF